MFRSKPQGGSMLASLYDSSITHCHHYERFEDTADQDKPTSNRTHSNSDDESQQQRNSSRTASSNAAKQSKCKWFSCCRKLIGLSKSRQVAPTPVIAADPWAWPEDDAPADAPKARKAAAGAHKSQDSSNSDADAPKGRKSSTKASNTQQADTWKLDQQSPFDAAVRVQAYNCNML